MALTGLEKVWHKRFGIVTNTILSQSVKWIRFLLFRSFGILLAAYFFFQGKKFISSLNSSIDKADWIEFEKKTYVGAVGKFWPVPRWSRRTPTQNWFFSHWILLLLEDIGKAIIDAEEESSRQLENHVAGVESGVNVSASSTDCRPRDLCFCYCCC